MNMNRCNDQQNVENADEMNRERENLKNEHALERNEENDDNFCICKCAHICRF